MDLQDLLVLLVQLVLQVQIQQFLALQDLQVQQGQLVQQVLLDLRVQQVMTDLSHSQQRQQTQVYYG